LKTRPYKENFVKKSFSSANAALFNLNKSD